ncbi:unnamed protein product [Enterobius vermicularis]|uniref:Uncharacterized protein n=1 Tax=Enterobius vermicularis TaxID=51028 RepID=A0A0N4UUU1_ENTVE|nr:unnamed protein product [Enterobius vermicularis]
MGVQSDLLIDTCTNSAKFFFALVRSGTASLELLDLLLLRCFSSYDDAVKDNKNLAPGRRASKSLKIIMNSKEFYPSDLVNAGTSFVSDCLDVLSNHGLEKEELGNAVSFFPAVLFTKDASHMATVSEIISSFFPRPQLRNILKFSPHILLHDPDRLELKYEYIYYHMGLEAEDFGLCKMWVDLPLEEIMARHEFLVKAGKYVFPDEKKPQLAKENPKLQAILDTTDIRFAEKVAGVSLEEWEVYKSLAVKLREQSELDVPYQRIKPSLRKLFERKLKAAKESEPYKFESGTT